MELLRFRREQLRFPPECLVCARPAEELRLRIGCGVKAPLCAACRKDRIESGGAGWATVALLATAVVAPALRETEFVLALCLPTALILSALWFSWRPLPWQRRLSISRASDGELVLAVADVRLASQLHQSLPGDDYRRTLAPMGRRRRRWWSRLRVWLASV
jgi:hypothetical protein